MYTLYDKIVYSVMFHGHFWILHMTCVGFQPFLMGFLFVWYNWSYVQHIANQLGSQGIIRSLGKLLDFVILKFLLIALKCQKSCSMWTLSWAAYKKNLCTLNFRINVYACNHTTAYHIIDAQARVGPGPGTPLFVCTHYNRKIDILFTFEKSHLEIDCTLEIVISKWM